MRHLLLDLVRDESGQSITEYGAIIAFVGCLIAMAFHLANGGLFAGISGAYSACTSQLGNLNNYAVTSTS